MYDNVGNSVIRSLTCTIDNTAPTAPSITGVTELSENLDYNDPTFYYSNDQAMGDSFTIHLTTGDGGGSGLLKAVGSSEFGGSVLFVSIRYSIHN
jgi:hypothetical protein